MKVAGSAVLHASPDQVWRAINDPAVLATVIPGCDRLDPLGDGHFGLTVHLGVAAIKGSYSGEVKLYDKVEPSALTMRAAGSGAPGTIDTTVAVRLADPGDGTTVLDYDADAVVGGAVGGVGQRVLTSVAKKTAGQFFSAIDDVLTGKKAVQAPAPATAGAPAVLAAVTEAAEPEFGATLARPAATAPAGAPAISPIALLGAAVLGAAIMLGGILVGSRLGRRHR